VLLVVAETVVNGEHAARISKENDK
jgi:hypothetical protein